RVADGVHDGLASETIPWLVDGSDSRWASPDTLRRVTDGVHDGLDGSETIPCLADASGDRLGGTEVGCQFCGWPWDLRVHFQGASRVVEASRDGIDGSEAVTR